MNKNPIIHDFSIETDSVDGFPVQTFKNRFRSLWDMFSGCSRHYQDLLFLIQGEDRLTYRQSANMAIAMAAYLKRNADVGHGDNVGILMENSIGFIITFWGIQKLGATAVVFNTRLAPVELKRQIEFSDLKLLVSSPAMLPKMQEIPLAQAPLQIILGNGWQDTLQSATGEKIKPSESFEDDTALILFTSGTSGLPKGVMITHRNLITSAIKQFPIQSSHNGLSTEKILIAAPLFHVLALQEQMIPALLRGSSCVLVPAFNAGEVLEIAARERISVMSGSPTMFWLLLHKTEIHKMKLDSMRRISYGGAPMPPELLKEIRQTFPGVTCYNGYGLTEASVATRLLDEFCDSHPTSIGQPTPCTEVKIVDPLTGNTVGPHSVGEMALRGALVSRGYYKLPEQTAQVYRQGWFHTGDLGYRDSEGFLYLAGRLKEMINRGGENVYPVEVENVLGLHPKVLDVAVFGIPDPVMGSAVACAVVPKSNEDDIIDIKEVKNFCSKWLADYKIPTRIFYASELPRNAGGKVMKAKLTEQYK